MLFHQDYISTCYFTRTTSVHAVSPGLHQYMLSHLDSINTCHLTRTISVHAISSGLHQYMSDQDYVSTCYLTRTTSGHAISLGLHQHMLSHQDFKVWDRVCAEAWPVKGHSVGVVHSVQRLNGAREQSVLRLPQASCAKTALHQSIYLPLLLPHIMAPSISQYICHFYCLTSWHPPSVNTSATFTASHHGSLLHKKKMSMHFSKECLWLSYRLCNTNTQQNVYIIRVQSKPALQPPRSNDPPSITILFQSNAFMPVKKKNVKNDKI